MRCLPWLALLLTLLPAVPAAAARAAAELVAPGETVAGWRLQRREHHPEYLRLFFTHGGQRTAIEVARRGSATGPWTTRRYRLMPAPGATPPPELLAAVMARLRRYDTAGEVALVERDRRGAGGTRGGASSGPRGPPPVRLPLWLWLTSGLGGVALVLACRRRSLREPMRRMAALVERRPWPWLLAILAAMAIPRLVALGTPFTIDAMTQRVFFGSLDVGDILLHRYPDQRHPPLYYLVLHAALWLGHDESIARLPAAICSLLAAAATFSLGRRALGAWRALLLVALLGLSTSFLEHSREVGDLTLFMWLSVLSSALLLRNLQAPGRGVLLALAACELAMLYTYYLAAIVVAAHLLVALVMGRGPARKRPVSAIAVALLIALPEDYELLALVAADRGARQIAHADPAHMWGEQSSGELLAAIGRQLAPGGTMMLLFAALATVGFGFLWQRRAGRPLALLCGLLVVLPLAVLSAGATVVRLKPYYALFALPFALLLAVAGCLPPAARVREPVPNAAGRAAGIGLGLLLAGALGLELRARLPELLTRRSDAPRYDEIGRAIKAAGEPRTVIADGNNLHTMLLYYGFDDPLQMYRHCRLADADAGGTECHAGDQHLVTLTVLPKLSAGWQQRSVRRLARKLRRPSWVVYAGSFANPHLLAALRSRCALRGRYAPGQGLLLFRCLAR